MRRVLILFAHPVLERSRVNRRLLDAIRDVEGVTIRDLYEDYPTLFIDVKREQADLVEHDIIVFQHPFYWYSCPAILKDWQDLVLEHGWAYGVGGNQLRGKITLNAIPRRRIAPRATTGSRSASCSRPGIRPRTCAACGSSRRSRYTRR